MKIEAITEKERGIIARLVGLKDKSKIVLNDKGWTSRVYLIKNGEIVFKFPRTEAIKEEYKHEIVAYKHVENAEISLKFPKLRWVHPDYEYIGYDGIKGVMLYKILDDLSVEERRDIGTKIGGFLKWLHATEIAGAPIITLEDEQKSLWKKFNKARAFLEKELTGPEFKKVEALASELFLGEMKKLGYDKVLSHGDLGFWNVIYGGGDNLGIIDFGDIGYYDHSIDFAGMSDGEILDAALLAYGPDDTLRKKAELRIATLPICELYFFLEKKNEKRIEKTVGEIRAGLKRL